MFQTLTERRMFALSWTILLHVLLLVPGDNLKEEKIFILPHLDKIAHFGLYLVLVAGWILFINLRPDLKPEQKKKGIKWLLALAIADGFLVEIIQGTDFIRRDFDLLDALADTLGAVTGLYAGHYITRKLTATNFHR